MRFKWLSAACRLMTSQKTKLEDVFLVSRNVKKNKQEILILPGFDLLKMILIFRFYWNETVSAAFRHHTSVNGLILVLTLESSKLLFLLWWVPFLFLTAETAGWLLRWKIKEDIICFWKCATVLHVYSQTCH